MFESICQDTARNLGTHYTSLATSVLVHSALACALVFSQLLLIQGGTGTEIATFIARVPETLGSSIPSPPPAMAGGPGESRAPDEKASYSTRVPREDMEMPSKIPSFLPPPAEDPVFRTASNTDGTPGGNSRGGAGFLSGTGLMPMLDYAPLPPLKMPEPPAAAKAPVRIGVLNPSRLIFRVSPKYPVLAHRLGVSGIVTLEAMVDEEGAVKRVEVVEGHPLLRDSAVEAVKQWRYSPTIQNGEPIPVIATIRIVYKIER